MRLTSSARPLLETATLPESDRGRADASRSVTSQASGSRCDVGGSYAWARCRLDAARCAQDAPAKGYARAPSGRRRRLDYGRTSWTTACPSPVASLSDLSPVARREPSPSRPPWSPCHLPARVRRSAGSSRSGGEESGRSRRRRRPRRAHQRQRVLDPFVDVAVAVAVAVVLVDELVQDCGLRPTHQVSWLAA